MFTEQVSAGVLRYSVMAVVITSKERRNTPAYWNAHVDGVTPATVFEPSLHRVEPPAIAPACHRSLDEIKARAG